MVWKQLTWIMNKSLINISISDVQYAHSVLPRDPILHDVNIAYESWTIVVTSQAILMKIFSIPFSMINYFDEHTQHIDPNFSSYDIEITLNVKFIINQTQNFTFWRTYKRGSEGLNISVNINFH